METTVVLMVSNANLTFQLEPHLWKVIWKPSKLKVTIKKEYLLLKNETTVQSAMDLTVELMEMLANNLLFLPSHFAMVKTDNKAKTATPMPDFPKVFLSATDKTANKERTATPMLVSLKDSHSAMVKMANKARTATLMLDLLNMLQKTCQFAMEPTVQKELLADQPDPKPSSLI